MFIWRNRNQTSSFLGLCDGGGGFQTVPSSLILVPFHPTCWIPEWGWLPTLRPVISSLLHTAMVFKVWILRAITLSSSPSSWGIEMSPPATTALHKHSTCFWHPWFYSRTSPIVRRWCDSDVTTQGLSLRVWEPSQKASSNLVITSSDIV